MALIKEGKKVVIRIRILHIKMLQKKGKALLDAVANKEYLAYKAPSHCFVVNSSSLIWVTSSPRIIVEFYGVMF